MLWNLSRKVQMENDKGRETIPANPIETSKNIGYRSSRLPNLRKPAFSQRRKCMKLSRVSPRKS